VSQDPQRSDVPTGPAPAEPGTVAPEPAAADESTVGTGTSIALGCIGATLLLIVFALIMLGITTLF
jgi:hypothetical protein